MEIRVANEDDALEIRNIYAYYVENTFVSFEYEVPSVEEMKKRIMKTLKRYPYLVAVIDGKIVGYAYASSFKGRKAYDWSCELSIYVDVNMKRKGIGKQLYNKLFAYLKKMNIKALYACLGYPNDVSENFHQSFGFQTIGHFSQCGYKFHQWIDMIWMEKHIGQFDDTEDIIPFMEVYER